jgi:DNA-binding Xre family transcriptional regulator
MNPRHVRLREHRKAKGLTLEALGKAAGVSLFTIHRIETGKVARVEYPTLRKLSRALETTVGDLTYPPESNQR